MPTFWSAPSKNFISTTLNGAINDSVTTITLNSVTSLPTGGGTLVIDREDGNGNATPSSREVISYTGISGNDLTGVTRGFDGSTAKSHSDGALVEATFVVGMWNDLRDAVAAALSTDGANLSMTGTASVADLSVPKMAATSLASLSVVNYKATKPALTTDSDGATVTFDMDASNLHQVTLGGNRTLDVTNDDVGQPFILRLTQDGTGSRTVTWFGTSPATIYWAGGTEPTLTTTANKTDVFGFLKSTASTYDGYIVGQNI